MSENKQLKLHNKSYAAPCLIRFGKFSELTQHKPGHCVDGASGKNSRLGPPSICGPKTK
jgi:hypothetical protein